MLGFNRIGNMRSFAQKLNQPQRQVSSSFARSRATLEAGHPANPLAHLQSTFGNQAVQRRTEAETRIRCKTRCDNQVRIAPPIVHEVLRSSGQPLDAATRAL